jgi:hypothetical protein
MCDEILGLHPGFDAELTRVAVTALEGAATARARDLCSSIRRIVR